MATEKSPLLANGSTSIVTQIQNSNSPICRSPSVDILNRLIEQALPSLKNKFIYYESSVGTCSSYSLIYFKILDVMIEEIDDSFIEKQKKNNRDVISKKIKLSWLKISDNTGKITYLSGNLVKEIDLETRGIRSSSKEWINDDRCFCFIKENNLYKILEYSEPRDAQSAASKSINIDSTESLIDVNKNMLLILNDKKSTRLKDSLENSRSQDDSQELFLKIIIENYLQCESKKIYDSEQEMCLDKIQNTYSCSIL